MTSEEERFRKIVDSVVSGHSWRNFIAIVVAAFTSGGWAAKVHFDLADSQKEIERDRAATEQRVKEWAIWRAGTTSTLERNVWILDNHESRIMSLEKQ